MTVLQPDTGRVEEVDSVSETEEVTETISTEDKLEIEQVISVKKFVTNTIEVDVTETVTEEGKYFTVLTFIIAFIVILLIIGLYRVCRKRPSVPRVVLVDDVDKDEGKAQKSKIRAADTVLKIDETNNPQ